MYSITRPYVDRMGPFCLFRSQLPTFLASLVIAELFFKLGSFALECVAFLITWFFLDFLLEPLRKPVSTKRLFWGRPFQGSGE